MNAIPTGGRAPSPDGDGPEATEVDGSSAAWRRIPAPRSGADPLPQRARPGAHGTGAAPPGTGPERDPDGRPYTTPDAMTLSRLLTGLRHI
jgi:hypothetical protein